MRNLDLSALRSFVAIAEVGGMTRAANLLNLTQSAVSMQIKRLEEAVGVELLVRANRTVTLTSAGEQLLGYAQNMIELNDEVLSRLTDSSFEGQLTLGVPHDIVYPHVPGILQRFAVEFPRVRVQLVSSVTRRLHELFERGEADMILTTEDTCGSEGETLVALPLVWIGAPGGSAWRSRPLRLAFEPICVFRAPVLRALENAGIPWEMGVESDSTRTIEASLSADLAVHAVMAGTTPPRLEEIAHGGALPELPTKQINLYVSRSKATPPRDRLAELVRTAYHADKVRRVA